MRVLSFFVAISSGWALVVHAGSPPSIFGDPVDQSVDRGRSVEFYSEASTSDGNPSFQWYYEGMALPGQSGIGPQTYLRLTNVMSSDEGRYWVIFSNSFGAATSKVAYLTVLLRPPVIISDPASVQVCQGAGVTLYTSAQGSFPLHYQWQLNGTNLPGGDGFFTECFCTPGTTWSISAAGPSNSGDYRVVLTNSFGARTTAVAQVTINTSPPILSSMVTTQSVLAGEDAIFYAIGSNACGGLHFRWQHEGIELPPNDYNFLHVISPTTNDAGYYSVVASNNYGAVTGTVGYLIVREQAPAIEQQPLNQNVYADETAVFSVFVRAGPPAQLQWRLNGTNIAGATSSVLYFYATSTNQSGYGFSLVASNYLGAVTSVVATLRVTDIAPYFYQEPLNRGIVAGSPLTLTAFAAGNPYPIYQWRFNGTNIPAATNNSLAFAVISTNNSGEYTVVAMSEAGSVTSRVATVVVSPPGPLDHWSWRNPLPQGNDLKQVAYGNGTFVALGNDGTKVSSHDGGITWHDRTQGSGYVGSVAYGNGTFIRASYQYDPYNVLIETSPDGIVWTQRSISSQNVALYDIAFGNGRFVAVGNSYASVSTNGIDWIEYSLGDAYAYRLAFGNGVFLGLTTDSAGHFLISTNGESWTVGTAALPNFITHVVFAAGKFVGTAWTYSSDPAHPYEALAFVSQDALSWTERHIGFDFQPEGLAYGNGKFVVVGGFSNGVAAVSTDALNWTTTNVFQSHELYGAAFGGGTFVAVGNYGNILTSTDGLNWTARSAGSSVNLRSVTRGGSTYVAAGNDGLLFTSSNAVSWTRRPPPTAANIRSVTWGQRPSGAPLLAAVGEADGDGALVLTSSNGIAWSRSHIATPIDLYSVTFADGNFVAVGEGIVTSSDGVNWSLVRAVSDEKLNAVTHAQGTFVAVGRSGRILVSGTGTIWVQRTLPITPFLQGVAYGNGRFVAGGRGANVVTSTNAAQWTIQTNAVEGGIEDITFGNGLFLAVGDNGLLISSPDGAIWTKHRPIRRPDFRGIIYADGRFLAVGNNEAILQSGFIGPPVLRVRHFADDGFEFSVDGEAGRNYRVQGSSNLRNWIDLGTFSNNEETTLFLDSDVEDFLQRFYRVVSP